ncbi:Autophagy-Related Protein 9A [Manis pentadactyla]|nr:Autophagy-Related Protein 9A [Manis pentadactyla]
MLEASLNPKPPGAAARGNHQVLSGLYKTEKDSQMVKQASQQEWKTSPSRMRQKTTLPLSLSLFEHLPFIKPTANVHMTEDVFFTGDLQSGYLESTVHLKRSDFKEHPINLIKSSVIKKHWLFCLQTARLPEHWRGSVHAATNPDITPTQTKCHRPEHPMGVVQPARVGP